MDWSGKADFVVAEKREWLLDGKRVGLTRSARGLTFATIDGAGHMVCVTDNSVVTVIADWEALQGPV